MAHDKKDIQLGNVDNTSDVNKPVSTAQATSIGTKEPTIASGTTSQYWRGDKTWQPLPNTDVITVNGVQYIGVQTCSQSKTVSSGTVTFYLTNDGTATGTALFPTNVFIGTGNFWVNDAINQYQMGGYTLSTDHKSLTLTVNKIGLSLGILVFIASTTGTTINMSIRGN